MECKNSIKMPKTCIMEKDRTQHSECIVVAAVGRNLELGRGGGLIWHLRGDLRHFRDLTMGHAVVMGRRTWQSLPKGALPGRRNIVVTRNPDFVAPGAETAASLQEALQMCAGTKAFIIGGGEVYAAAMSMATGLHLTLVDGSCPEADTWFPAFAADWVETGRTVGAQADGSSPAYEYVDYVRRPEP